MDKRFEKGSRKWTVAVVLIGVLIGVVLLLLVQKTLKYTDSPKFCNSCHIMNQVTENMLASSHSGLSCNDCHLPHDNTVKKLAYKTKYGVRDMYANSIGRNKIPDVIHTSKESSGIINKNCVSCHKHTIKRMSYGIKDSCVSCHQGVPHGNPDFKTKDYYEMKTYEIPETSK